MTEAGQYQIGYSASRPTSRIPSTSENACRSHYPLRGTSALRMRLAPCLSARILRWGSSRETSTSTPLAMLWAQAVRSYHLSGTATTGHLSTSIRNTTPTIWRSGCSTSRLKLKPATRSDRILKPVPSSPPDRLTPLWPTRSRSDRTKSLPTELWRLLRSPRPTSTCYVTPSIPSAVPRLPCLMGGYLRRMRRA